MTHPGASGAKVYLVGAGPGDPDLLTVKAARLIGAAEVVVYDRLVGKEVLALAPAGATRIFVGKARRRHSLSQDEINDLLLRLARSGRRVVRLKGGDPFVFGRGSEEAEYLARHGVACEIVPGITSASGCTAELGIPLTHRGLASGVRFIAGHCRGDAEPELDWRGLADPDTTLVIYMGLATLGRIAERLMAAGLGADTPAIAIASGTTPERRLCRGTLGDLVEKVAAAGLSAPTLVVVGRVVDLADVIGLWPADAAPDAARYA
jgi:uroporphyrin-III C-methyltransferase/precorrin-2 dehydrogenase/sirohydrochlorin ferrochelatase/uroporphyrin-III C-methyltransferase